MWNASFDHPMMAGFGNGGWFWHMGFHSGATLLLIILALAVIAYFIGRHKSGPRTHD